jgi:hypothetical protein
MAGNWNEEVEMHATKTMTLASMLVLAVGLSACGTSQTDRAITGGGLGAGVGALGGAAVGHPIAGALIGGAGGAAAGALTNHNVVNFGKPIWKWD